MSNSKEIKVIVVDDKDIIRDGLKMLLNGMNGVIIAAEASSGEMAVELIANNNFDVVLMDISMSNMDGIKATKRILELKTDIKILTNSCHATSDYIQEMILAGASGYITKGESRENYLEAIWTVYNSGIYLSDQINNETYDEVLGYLKHPIKRTSVVA